MSGNFERLEREQIAMRRELARKLETGGPQAKARAVELRELADRMERQVEQRAALAELNADAGVTDLGAGDGT